MEGGEGALHERKQDTEHNETPQWGHFTQQSIKRWAALHYMALGS